MRSQTTCSSELLSHTTKKMNNQLRSEGLSKHVLIPQFRYLDKPSVANCRVQKLENQHAFLASHPTPRSNPNTPRRARLTADENTSSLPLSLRPSISHNPEEMTGIVLLSSYLRSMARNKHIACVFNLFTQYISVHFVKSSNTKTMCIILDQEHNTLHGIPCTLCDNGLQL